MELEEMSEVKNEGLEVVAIVGIVPGTEFKSLTFFTEFQEMDSGSKLYAAPVAKQVVMPELIKKLRAIAIRERMFRIEETYTAPEISDSISLLNNELDEIIHLYAAPVAKQVVMPERDKLECLLDEVCGTNGTIPTDEPIYSISLSEVAEVIHRLNAADQGGGV